MPGNSTNPAGVETVENLSSEIRSALGRLLIQFLINNDGLQSTDDQLIVTKYFGIPYCIGNICVPHLETCTARLSSQHK